MTDLDLTPAGLRKLAAACDRWSYELKDMEDGMPTLAHTLRALADQMEAEARKQNSASPCQLCGDTTGVCKRVNTAAANCPRRVMAWSGTAIKDTQP